MIDQAFTALYPRSKVPFKDIMDAMLEAKVDTILKQMAFIAQWAHESMGFTHLLELASGKAYEGRSDLGNNMPGDGEKYKGRGICQLTGKRNYKYYGDKLSLDLVDHPELAADPSNACRIAAAYWTDHKLNELAGKMVLGLDDSMYKDTTDNFKKITKAINGGYNGLTLREKELHRLVVACRFSP